MRSLTCAKSTSNHNGSSFKSHRHHICWVCLSLIYAEKCKIGSGPQNEWYFFSHKDKKYPTGTRTNRATIAGFWKATGRDKAVHLGNSKQIGMRKTLVFYVGRAPHGQKTDWIMHEYRLEDDTTEVQVCVNIQVLPDFFVFISVFL